MRETPHRRRVIGRARRAGRGLFAALCLLAALVLNLPYTRPGFGDMRDVLVLVLAAAGVLAGVPFVWAWRARFRSPRVRAIAGVIATAAWTAGAGAAMLTLLFLTAPVGFMQSRALEYTIRSRDGRLTFYGSRRDVWDKIGPGDLSLGVGPFELVVIGPSEVGDAFRGKVRDLHTWGHRLQWPEGQEPRIDGEPATLEWRE